MSQVADDAVGGELDGALLRRLLAYLKPVWWLVALALVALLVNSALNLVGPLILQQAIDVAIPRKDTGLLATLAAAMLGAMLLEFLAEYLGTVLTTLLGQRVMHSLRILASAAPYWVEAASSLQSVTTHEASRPQRSAQLTVGGTGWFAPAPVSGCGALESHALASARATTSSAGPAGPGLLRDMGRILLPRLPPRQRTPDSRVTTGRSAC